ncbi:AMP-dependent synthetase/ligase [Hymenobacter negativus]|uniref:Long-chain fatty acid--CoA ligase n=1 Tax=Hymenobacter negativus TaxID=2795026 RepID=A0ABS0Q9N4_9BACT|nr:MULTISPECIES: long-chain fatty acid--CoA ligase [Bacteria]MBH8559182.1 long-chain fatty acid--CoA ligase [Hymenobacter negativus]MBH8569930.1 long-chain fatty acid--CoA ligase [Hymenobacter negativus]MBR7209669.1 long-chain fatty acid--CoA ligase [Microvirga sp. STS02]
MDVRRAFDILAHQIAESPKSDALASKIDGNWVPISSQQLQDQVNLVSLGLVSLGLKRGDKVAIISMNRPEWMMADFGISQIGATSVPMYPSITVEDYKYIFTDAGVRAVFVADKKLFDKVKEATQDLDIPAANIFTFDKVEGARHFSELLELGKKGNAADLEPLKAAVEPDDLLTLIYTSGTTGKPKGVMLTHDNILSNCRNSQRFVPVTKNDKALSFLPLCHIFERMVTYLYMINGVSIYYAENMDVIADNLREVKPEIFTTVPRLLEKVYDKIVQKGHELEGIKKSLFFWALDLGLKYDTQKDQGFFYNTQLALANKLIFNKWREALGGNLRCIVSGGGALQPRLARVFWAAGIRVMEGYGLTETSPVIAVGGYEPENNMIGTVGPLIDNMDVKIAADGEILTKSASVMKGYYNKPDLTAEVFDQEGWFHTGDIGELVNGKFLKITDRKKEMFKTSGGKYIAPQVIEGKLKEDPLIEQAMVVGADQKFASALVIPSFPDLKGWCKRNGVPDAPNEELVKNEKVVKLYKDLIDKYNKGFAQWEQVKRHELLPTLWTVESGEMTPTMKVKRKVITENNKDLIAGIYDRAEKEPHERTAH